MTPFAVLAVSWGIVFALIGATATVCGIRRLVRRILDADMRVIQAQAEVASVRRRFAAMQESLVLAEQLIADRDAEIARLSCSDTLEVEGSESL